MGNGLSESEYSSFRPKARLLNALGSELISSDKVAVIELVKNGYDADAANIIIRFKSLEDECNAEIQIIDDGIGMGRGTIENSWFVIATDVKKIKGTSPGGRVVLGSKGIGRLAASRLGDSLVLFSKHRDEPAVKVEMRWSDFDDDAKFLDEIEVKWSTISEKVIFEDYLNLDVKSSTDESFAYSKTGTVLSITKLSHFWKEDDIEEVRTALRRLVPPKIESQHLAGVDKNQGFRIFMEFVDCPPEYSKYSGEVQPPDIVRTPHFFLKGKVLANGKCCFRYRSIMTGATEEVFEKDLWVGESNPSVGPFEFEINAWELDNKNLKILLAKTDRQERLTSNEFRVLLSGVAGMNIYRDGFRVLPFGERGNDWLGLDLRRVQNPTMRLSNNQISGYVYIDSINNAGLKDQSNREGIIIGPEFEELKAMLTKALMELESRRFLAKGNTPKGKKSITALSDELSLEKTISEITEILPAKSPVLEMLKKKQVSLEHALNDVAVSVSRYTRLANLGSLVDKVLHDGRNALAVIKPRAKISYSKLSSSTYTDDLDIQWVRESQSMIQAESSKLETLFNQLVPFGGKAKRVVSDVNLREVLSEIESYFEDEIKKHGIRFEANDVDFTIKVNRDEIYTVLFNLIHNSIYWVEQLKKSKPKIILIEGKLKQSGICKIIVSDSGPGVDVEYREKIFDAYFSRKPNGIGLGLSIVGHLLEDFYNGEVRLLDEGKLGGASFEIVLKLGR